MRHEDKLKEKAGSRLPYNVPEGYFESFKERMLSSLPDYPEKPRQPDMTLWQRIRPYVYLAAMFAGIWCMMQIFHRVSSPAVSASDEYALAYFEPDSYDFYIDGSSGQDIAVEDEVMTLYPNMDALKRDFYAQM